MKKKEIEKIPYLTLSKVCRKKDVRYIGVTACKDIGGVRHLFLEVYRNCRETRDVPLVRIVITQKDFGNFFPVSGEWSRQKIKAGIYSNSGELLWHTREDICTWEEMPVQNILMGREDLERLQGYCGIRIWDEKRWWEYIYDHEDRIVRNERNRAASRRYDRRQQALGDRIAHTPELPEQEILDRADTILFRKKHYLYYKKRGCRVQIACSKCGGVTNARYKDGISYESGLQKQVDDPRRGHIASCLMCGAVGEYREQGRIKGRHVICGHMFLGQKYKEEGMVVRYIRVEKYWELGLHPGKEGPEMYNAREGLSGVEIARAYILPGEKTQIDYHKNDPYSGKDFWDDCNLYGNANITIGRAPVMEETYKEMKGTMFRYSAVQEYIKAAGEVNLIDYLERYKKTPQIEMLVKLGLTEVVRGLVRYHYEIVRDERADRVDTFLGIRKERVRQLIGHKGDIGILTAMQTEKRLGQDWTEEQIEQIAELGQRHIDRAMEYMGIQQFLNKVSKYAGCDYGTRCSTASDRLRHMAQTYIDYLQMRRDLGYDMQNTVYLFPRDLEAAHRKMVAESNKKKADDRIREVDERYPGIRKGYRRLRKQFFFEDGEFLIRPARDAGEIVMEGRLLHHCVGGDTYLQGHDKGTNIILFLRSKEDPDTPYITVEIDAAALRVKQWYGAHDKQPDRDRMQRWLNAYATRLRCSQTAAGGKEIENRLPAYA